MTEHDAGYKLLFSDPNITRSLLADFLPQEWQQQHHQAGLTEGMVRDVAQGEQALLLRLLHRRFGEIPEATRQRLEQAGTDKLETWADRVLDAKTLAEVFC